MSEQQPQVVVTRSGNGALKVVLFLVAAGAAAYYFVPNFRTKVNQQVDKLVGWNEEAIRKDPVGFIDHAISTLEKNIAKFDLMKSDLAVAKAKIQQLHESNGDKLSFASKQLDEFKDAYKEAKEEKEWPAEVAGKEYSELELKQQVGLVLTQKGGYENVAKATQAAFDLAGKREMEVVGGHSESKAKLELLRTQRELVKVNQLTAETEKLLAEVKDVLVQNEALTADTKVRTVEELMKQAESGAVKSNANVDAFLDG